MDFIRKILLKKYILLTLFAIAMGFLEAIVVVYVRELFYPEGFNFPLKPLPGWLISVELVRELCTLIMLGTVSWLTGRNSFQRLAVFLFIFGIWDIFYYIGLKVYLDWPASLLTWDILFLIPITWIGPVLAPVICSIVMIGMAILFEWSLFSEKTVGLRFSEMVLLFTGAGLILYTFVYDFGKIIIEGNFLHQLISLPDNPEFTAILTSFVPTHYQWVLFSTGIIIILISILLFVKRSFR